MEVRNTPKLADILEKVKKTRFGGIRKTNYQQTYGSSNILSDMIGVGMFRSEDFRIDDNNRFAYTNLAKWLAGDPTMECIDPRTNAIVKGDLNKGIYLAGSTGTGKSWAMEIVGFLAGAYGMRVSVGGTTELFDMRLIHSSDLVRDYCDAGNIVVPRILCVNDLGAEPKEGVYMGNRTNVLKRLIETRGDRDDLMTCFTSNYPMGHKYIVDQYGDRVASRLRSMCNYLEIRGEDRRK